MPPNHKNQNVDPALVYFDGKFNSKAGLFSYGKSARFQVPKNGTSGAETKRRRPLFNANYPPKWWGRHLVHEFPFSGEYQANF